MDISAWRSRFRGSTFPSRLVHTPSMSRPALFSIAAALCLSACTTTAPLATQAPTASLASPTVLVPERYVSADNPGDEIDSLASWPTEDGHAWLVATAKSSHSLVVFDARSDEHTSELQSLMRISYAVFCLKKKKHIPNKSLTKPI